MKYSGKCQKKLYCIRLFRPRQKKNITSCSLLYVESRILLRHGSRKGTFLGEEKKWLEEGEQIKSNNRRERKK